MCALCLCGKKNSIMNKTKHIIKLLAVVLVFSSFAPRGVIESKHENYLFKINRSRNADEIRYTVNLDKSGIPDKEVPIKAYWVRKSRNNETGSLSWIQNKYAYGIRIVQEYNKQTENMKFQFVSYAEQTFELRKTVNGAFKVFTTIENKEIEVARIFVQIDGGSFWVPSIPFVKITGYDVTSSNLIAQTITP